VKKRFSEEQIIGFLRDADNGVPVKELCRQGGFSEASYYVCRKHSLSGWSEKAAAPHRRDSASIGSAQPPEGVATRAARWVERASRSSSTYVGPRTPFNSAALTSPPVATSPGVPEARRACQLIPGNRSQPSATLT